MYHICSNKVIQGRAGLTAGRNSAGCVHTGQTRAQLNHGKARLGQGTGSGRLWTRQHLGRLWGLCTLLNQGSTDGSGGLSRHAHGWWLKEHCNGDGARPGHERPCTVGAAVTVQSANRGRALLGLTAGQGSSREVGLAAAVAQVGRGKKR